MNPNKPVLLMVKSTSSTNTAKIANRIKLRFTYRSTTSCIGKYWFNIAENLKYIAKGIETIRQKISAISLGSSPILFAHGSYINNIAPTIMAHVPIISCFVT